MLKEKYKLYNKEQSPETRAEISKCVNSVLSLNGTNFSGARPISDYSYELFLGNIADMQIDIQYAKVSPEEIAIKREALRVLIPLMEELETPDNIAIERYHIKNGKADILTFQETNFSEINLIGQSGLDGYYDVLAHEKEMASPQKDSLRNHHNDFVSNHKEMLAEIEKEEMSEPKENFIKSLENSSSADESVDIIMRAMG